MEFSFEEKYKIEPTVVTKKQILNHMKSKTGVDEIFVDFLYTPSLVSKIGGTVMRFAIKCRETENPNENECGISVGSKYFCLPFDINIIKKYFYSENFIEQCFYKYPPDFLQSMLSKIRPRIVTFSEGTFFHIYLCPNEIIKEIIKFDNPLIIPRKIGHLGPPYDIEWDCCQLPENMIFDGFDVKLIDDNN